MENVEQQPLLLFGEHTNLKNSSSGEWEYDSMEINGVRDFCREFCVESKRLWYLAGPTIFTALCQYMMGASTQIFAGQLGTIQLAAVTVENSVIAGFSYAIMFGMGSALDTLCGHAYGAGKLEMLGIYLQRSWIILNTSSIALMFTFIFGVSILKMLGQTPAISESAGRFAVWMIPQLFAYATEIPVAKFLQAQNNVIPVALISLVAAISHIFLSWLTMMKLGWELVGAAMVLDGSWWFVTLAQLFYVLWGSCGQAWSGFSWAAFQNLKEFVHVSFTTAIILGLQNWYLMALVLFAGYFQEAEASVDALSVCINIIGWTSQLALGLNAAISIRVSNELGYGRPRTARFSVIVVLLTSFLIGLGCTAVLLATRKQYPAFFTSSPDVMQLVEELTLLLGVSVIVTSAQYTLSGVAIGAGWQSIVAYMNVVSYFLVGIPTSYLLGYKFNMGVKGIWYGMVTGVGLQSCLLLILICRTDWNKEAYVAGDRIKKWGQIIHAKKEDEEEQTRSTNQD